MLVCEEPLRFYAAMKAAGFLRRSPAFLRLLDPVLPPTQVRLAGEDWLVKASVLSLHALLLSTSIRRRDQFVAGRLFQNVSLVFGRDGDAVNRIEQAIASARRITLDWVAPDLPASFDAGGYVRQLFRTSFRFEVRPETRGRADALFEAQAERLIPIFTAVLAALCEDGRLQTDGSGRFSLVAAISPVGRLQRRLFMEWSKARATARWPKHALTFDGWLDYVIRKAERHSGETIELTRLERRLPFIFLWPRALRFLLRQRGKGRAV
jgi:hypothetical protein